MSMQKSFLSLCWRRPKHHSQQQRNCVHHLQSLKINGFFDITGKSSRETIWYGCRVKQLHPNFNDTFIALRFSGHHIDNPLIWWKVYLPNYFKLLDAHSLLFRLIHMSFQPSLTSLMTTLPSWAKGEHESGSPPSTCGFIHGKPTDLSFWMAQVFTDLGSTSVEAGTCHRYPLYLSLNLVLKFLIRVRYINKMSSEKLIRNGPLSELDYYSTLTLGTVLPPSHLFLL